MRGMRAVDGNYYPICSGLIQEMFLPNDTNRENIDVDNRQITVIITFKSIAINSNTRAGCCRTILTT